VLPQVRENSPRAEARHRLTGAQGGAAIRRFSSFVAKRNDANGRFPSFVMPGLDPGIHHLANRGGTAGLPGQARQ
jgi:hypothetical protein